MRAELATLRQENAALKQEISILRNQPTPSHPSAPKQVDPSSNPAMPPSGNDNPSSPFKRKVLSANDSPSNDTLNQKFATPERTIDNQRDESYRLYNTLLSKQASMESTLNKMRA
ncbi:hypothetical protein HPB48_003709 [Haemaphysalis longicornis]|uniref:Uncharacterized protein n=1 Tax=Haemaphysalis longicornis TaxID=44386 RepID=A0A9J6FFM0_HAELO|nr:hypothetical protein HPB48_003709 [Haemaphysalis longicornis]